MRRAALLALATLLIGGCRKAAETEPLGSPGDSVAGTEARPNDRVGTSTQRSGEGSRSGVASSLIVVATTNPSEAQPCERVCGSLGDCLLADANYSTVAAGGLELMCLDLCVHSAEGAPAKAEFLACGSQTECGPLQACAERSWTALAAARKGPEISGVATTADPCKLGCGWMYACLYTEGPPGAASFDASIQMAVDSCGDSCDAMDEAGRDYYGRLAPCLINHCSSNGVYQCLEEVNPPYRY